MGRRTGLSIGGSSAGAGSLAAANNLSDLVSAQAARANLGEDGIWRPQDHGLIAWSFPPEVAANASAPSAGLLQVVRLKLAVARSITNVHLYISSTAGTSMTAGQNFAGIFQGTTPLGWTADQSTNWQSTGEQKMALASGPFSAAAGDLFVAFWARSTGTFPTFARAINVTGQANINLSAANSKYATANSGLTSTPPGTLGTLSASGVAYWAAVS